MKRILNKFSLYINNKRTSFINFLRVSNMNVRASMALMGLGQLMYHQVGRGLIYLIIEILGILFFSIYGFQWIVGLITLGTVEADPWIGKEGDNSVIFLLLGLLSIALLVLFIGLYISNIKDCYNTSKNIIKGEKPKTFKDDLKDLLDKKFYKTVLFFPLLGTIIFSVIPIIFMILIAFTNYGGDFVPPALVDWVGIDNFVSVFSLGDIGPTFFKILGWNIVWAILTTLINYIFGLLLAILLNKKIVKGKPFWRLFPILAYAIPGFITLTAFKFMFSQGGPINQILVSNGGKAISFLTEDGTWWARIIGLMVNAWLTIPSVMLLATGILSNINSDLYEAAKIDGASSFKQFKDITLPFVVFATTPTLITSFIGNFNNFGVFYFLRGKVTSDGYFVANDTDLLIKSISLIIFIITSLISLIIYIKSPAYKKEDTFR